jgi:hypothetical protein
MRVTRLVLPETRISTNPYDAGRGLTSLYKKSVSVGCWWKAIYHAETAVRPSPADADEEQKIP